MMSDTTTASGSTTIQSLPAPVAPTPQQGQHESEGVKRMSDVMIESELRRARDEAAESRTKLRDMEKERDAALSQVEALRGEVEGAKATTADLTAKLAATEEAMTTTKGSLEELQKIRTDEVLQRIPEDKREAVAGWPIEQLEVIASQFVTAETPQKPAGSIEAGAAGGAPSTEEYDPAKMTIEQMSAMDPATLGTLIDKQIQSGRNGFGTLG